MQWAWATSLDQLWRSPDFPGLLGLGAAVVFAIILLVALLRGDKSVANGILALIVLLAVGVAATLMMRGAGAQSSGIASAAPSQPAAAMPALACLDGLAGSTVEDACEHILYGSADAAAAAVSYTAGQIAALGRQSTDGSSAAAAGQRALQHVLERDRYGFVAQVLMERDKCTQFNCPAFQLFADPAKLKANMNDRVYDGFVTRYSASWGAPSLASVPSAAAAVGLPPSIPTGKPSSIDFPTSASIPPVNIMTPETPAPVPAAAAAARLPVARPPATAANAQSPASHPAPVAAKKKPAPVPPKPRSIAPVPAPAEPPARTN